MKTKLIVSAIFMVMIIAAHPVFSQDGSGCHKHKTEAGKEKAHEGCMLPGLTSEQTKQIEQLRIKHHKEILPLQNSIGEKQARLRSLETAEKADINAINKTIDEITALRAEMMKKGAAHRQEVRKILNDEQRLMFDTRQGQQCQKGKKGKKNCCQR